MDGAQDLREAAAEARAAREVLTDVGCVSGYQGLAGSVHDVVVGSIDRGERYYRERQYRVNVAAVASRVIRRAHREAHAGSVATCETCAADWAVLKDVSGVTAPAA